MPRWSPLGVKIKISDEHPRLFHIGVPPLGLSLSVNYLVATLGLAFLFGLSFRLGLGLLFCVSLKRRVRRTLRDLYSPYFLPEVMVKFTRKGKGHFVSLSESSMHLMECISGHNPRLCTVAKLLKLL